MNRFFMELFVRKPKKRFVDSCGKYRPKIGIRWVIREQTLPLNKAVHPKPFESKEKEIKRQKYPQGTGD